MIVRFARIAIASALLAGALLAGAPSARAVLPSERLADPALEARARALSEQIRCLVCQNENIDDSNADLAHDLRVLVRQLIVKGDTNQQVLDYLVARYGDFVLLKPPVQPDTYLLWFGPLIVLVLGASGIVLFFRRRRAAALPDPGAALSPDEAKEVARLLAEDR